MNCAKSPKPQTKVFDFLFVNFIFHLHFYEFLKVSDEAFASTKHTIPYLLILRSRNTNSTGGLHASGQVASNGASEIVRCLS